MEEKEDTILFDQNTEREIQIQETDQQNVKRNESEHLHDIRIITFNLLSPDVLSEESIANYYSTIKRNYMDFTNRVDKTKKLMLSWMKVNFIICVQEMSTQWKTALEPFFQENGYGFQYDVYSGGKMGVGIGYPTQHYDLLETDMFKCGTFIKPIYRSIKQFAEKTKTLQTQQTQQTQQELLDSDSSNDRSEIQAEADIKTGTILQELEMASDSKNTLITLLLRAKYFGKPVGKNLLVSTYHMPCKYKHKYYICSHVHALKVHLDDLMSRWNNVHGQTLSAMMAGDFNITSRNPEYKFLAGLEYTDSELKGIVHGIDGAILKSAKFIVDLDTVYRAIGQNLFSGMKLRSTHSTLHMKEPEYTNVSGQKDKWFVECLDYILINNLIDIRSCTVGLSVKDPTLSPCPNGLCPSDHLPLSASLRIR